MFTEGTETGHWLERVRVLLFRPKDLMRVRITEIFMSHVRGFTTWTQRHVVNPVKHLK